MSHNILVAIASACIIMLLHRLIFPKEAYRFWKFQWSRHKYHSIFERDQIEFIWDDRHVVDYLFSNISSDTWFLTPFLVLAVIIFGWFDNGVFLLPSSFEDILVLISLIGIIILLGSFLTLLFVPWDKNRLVFSKHNIVADFGRKAFSHGGFIDSFMILEWKDVASIRYQNDSLILTRNPILGLLPRKITLRAFPLDDFLRLERRYKRRTNFIT